MSGEIHVTNCKLGTGYELEWMLLRPQGTPRCLKFLLAGLTSLAALKLAINLLFLIGQGRNYAKYKLPL